MRVSAPPPPCRMEWSPPSLGGTIVISTARAPSRTASRGSLPLPRDDAGGEGRKRSVRGALSRHRPGALVVEHLADAGLFLRRQLGVVDREVGARRHALLERRPPAQFLEPALEVLELL